jgi:hypothetical protein
MSGIDERIPIVAAAEAAIALEFGQGVAESVVVDAQRGPKLGAGHWGSSAFECGEHTLVKAGSSDAVWVGLDVLVWGRANDLEVCSCAIGRGCELQFERLDVGGGTVLEGQPDATAAWAGPGEVDGMVGPSVQVPGAAQGLSEMGTDGFAHVVYDDDGNITGSLQLAQKSQ